MSAAHPSPPVDRYEAAWVTMLLIGIALIISGQVGHQLGWWNDFGDFQTWLGIGLAVAGLVIAILYGSSKRQVRGVRREVAGSREDIRKVGEDVRQVGEDVRHVGAEVRSAHQDIVGRQDQQTELLRQIRDRLPPGSASQP